MVVHWALYYRPEGCLITFNAILIQQDPQKPTDLNSNHVIQTYEHHNKKPYSQPSAKDSNPQQGQKL